MRSSSDEKSSPSAPAITISPSSTARARQRRAQRRLQLGEVAAHRLRDRGSAGRSRRRRGTPACGTRPTSARTASRRPRGSRRVSLASIGSTGGDRRAASKQTSHRVERRADQARAACRRTRGRAPGVPKLQRPSASRASIAGTDGRAARSRSSCASRSRVAYAATPMPASMPPSAGARQAAAAVVGARHQPRDAEAEQPAGERARVDDQHAVARQIEGVGQRRRR